MKQDLYYLKRQLEVLCSYLDNVLEDKDVLRNRKRVIDQIDYVAGIIDKVSKEI